MKVAELSNLTRRLLNTHTHSHKKGKSSQEFKSSFKRGKSSFKFANFGFFFVQLRRSCIKDLPNVTIQMLKKKL